MSNYPQTKIENDGNTTIQIHGDVLSAPKLLMHFDGGCQPKNPGGVAVCGFAIFDCSNKLLVEGWRMVTDGGPLATNNSAEYCGVGTALKFLADIGWHGTNLLIRGDSQLIVHQVSGKWKCKEEHLRKLRDRCLDLLEQIFPETAGTAGLLETNPFWRTEWVPREKNAACDTLSDRAFTEYQERKNAAKS